MIGIVTAKRRLAERTNQIAKRLESQKVQALVGELELDGALDRLAGFACPACRTRFRLPGTWLLIDGDVALFNQSLDKPIQQLGHRFHFEIALIVGELIEFFV